MSETPFRLCLSLGSLAMPLSLPTSARLQRPGLPLETTNGDSNASHCNPEAGLEAQACNSSFSGG